MTRHLTRSVLILIAMVSASLRAQVGGVVGGVVVGPGAQAGVTTTAPGSNQAAPDTGTAILRGRVFGVDSSQPLRRAQVRIFAPELRQGKVATTDQNGRYEFTELPAGRYTVEANKTGYVTSQYGQTRPNQPGKQIQVADA